MLVPSVERVSIAAFAPASLTVASAAHGRVAPVIGSIAAMPYSAAPLIWVNAPPTMIFDWSGAITIACTPSLADGAQLSNEPSVALNAASLELSLIHISEPTRQAEISYAVFCLKKKKKKKNKQKQHGKIKKKKRKKKTKQTKK